MGGWVQLVAGGIVALCPSFSFSLPSPCCREVQADASRLEAHLQPASQPASQWWGQHGLIHHQPPNATQAPPHRSAAPFVPEAAAAAAADDSLGLGRCLPAASRTRRAPTTTPAAPIMHAAMCMTGQAIITHSWAQLKGNAAHTRSIHGRMIVGAPVLCLRRSKCMPCSGGWVTPLKKRVGADARMPARAHGPLTRKTVGLAASWRAKALSMSPRALAGVEPSRRTNDMPAT